MDKSIKISQNVVTMTDFKPNIGYGAIAQVEAYWQALRGTRQMPKRSEIDPRGIEGALESTFIVERIAPGVARMRIAGSALNDLMGMEVRGMPITAFFKPDARRQVSDAIEEVFQRPSTCTMHLFSIGDVGNTPLEARMLLLPLKSDLGDVSRVLGCLVSVGEIGNAPRRFDITDQQIMNISTVGIPAGIPAGLPPALQPTPKPADASGSRGFAAPKTEFTPGSNPKRPAYLRLVKSDDGFKS